MRPSHPTRQRWPRRNQRCRSYAQTRGRLGPAPRQDHPPHAAVEGRLFIARRAEAAIAGRDVRRAAEDRLMPVQGRRPQRDVGGPRGVHLVRRDDLMLRFLESSPTGQTRSAWRSCPCGWFRCAVRTHSDFVRDVGIPAQHAGPRLREHALDERPHLLQLTLGALEDRGGRRGRGAPPVSKPTDHAGRVPDNRARRGHQRAIAPLKGRRVLGDRA